MKILESHYEGEIMIEYDDYIVNIGIDDLDIVSEEYPELLECLEQYKNSIIFIIDNMISKLKRIPQVGDELFAHIYDKDDYPIDGYEMKVEKVSYVKFEKATKLDIYIDLID